MNAPRLRRLYVAADIAAGARLDVDRDQANRLLSVLRMRAGEEILVFNGRDGEWTARLVGDRPKRPELEIGARTQPQTLPPNLHCLFAPLKQARLDYMVQKAVELGAGRLRPVLTHRGQVRRLSHGRIVANVVAAAEQCGLMSIPVVDPPLDLAQVIADWENQDTGRRIVFCDEAEARADPLAVLSTLKPTPLAVLVGPEGGFTPEERADLRSRPFVTALPLGPRIMRADTAAVAALALVQAAIGDWRIRSPAPDERR